MNTSSQKFALLIKKYPDEAEALSRLKNVIDSHIGDPLWESSSSRLYDLTKPSSLDRLGEFLNELITQGVLKQIVRVESPYGGGIEDFRSILEIPDQIHDWRSDQYIDINLDNIKYIYKIENMVDGSR